MFRIDQAEFGRDAAQRDVAKIGIEPGMLILQVNREPVSDAARR